MPIIHFSDKEAERRSNAYRHIHGIPAPKRTHAVVGGRKHKIKHSSLSRRKRSKNRKRRR